MPISLESCGAIRTSPNGRKMEKTSTHAPQASTARDLKPLQYFTITRLLCCIWRSTKVSKGKLHVWRHPPLSLAVSCLTFIEANLERARQDGVTRVDVNNIQEILSLRALKSKFGARPSDARCALLSKKTHSSYSAPIAKCTHSFQNMYVFVTAPEAPTRLPMLNAHPS